MLSTTGSLESSVGNAGGVSAVCLTRRGRSALLVGAASVGAAIIAASWWTQHATPAPPVAVAPSSVVVSDGDTLWSIAERVAPARDPRNEVSDLVRLNRLSSVDLVPGQVIVTR